MTIKEAVELWWKKTDCVVEGETIKSVVIPMEKVWENREKAEKALMQKTKAELVQHILYEH